MKGLPSGSFKATSSSNGSPLAVSCGSTENVRFCHHLSAERFLTPMSLAGSGKSVLWFVYPSLPPVGTYFLTVPPLSKTLRLHAKLDQPSWHTFTSIPPISTNKPVTIFCALSCFSFSLALVLVVTSSTAFTRHTKMALSSRVTTL